MSRIFLATFLFLLGCQSSKFSEVKTEPAEVYDVVFMPAGHGSGASVGPLITYRDGGTVLTFMDIPERYAVVLKCQHGKFVISGPKAKRLYKTLDRGDKVTIRYREVIRVVDGKESVVDLDFLDVVKTKAERTEASSGLSDLE